MTNANFDEVKNKVEAVLFSYGDWISPNEIMASLGFDSELLISNSLKELQKKYEKGFAFCIQMNENGKWRMALKEEFEDVVSDLISSVEIPKPILKVLSVIAYEQPVTKTRLSEILGKSVKQEVNYLYRSKFLSYEKRGIGKYYKVTKKFYDYFKLDENEDFRAKANKNMNEYLHDFSGEEQQIAGDNYVEGSSELDEDEN